MHTWKDVCGRMDWMDWLMDGRTDVCRSVLPVCLCLSASLPPWLAVSLSLCHTLSLHLCSHVCTYACSVHACMNPILEVVLSGRPVGGRNLDSGSEIWGSVLSDLNCNPKS